MTVDRTWETTCAGGGGGRRVPTVAERYVHSVAVVKRSARAWRRSFSGVNDSASRPTQASLRTTSHSSLVERVDVDLSNRSCGLEVRDQPNVQISIGIRTGEVDLHFGLIRPSESNERVCALPLSSHSEVVVRRVLVPGNHDERAP